MTKTPEMTSVADTLVGFLKDTASTYGKRDALLFKPGFRYQRWSYRDLWEGAGRVASLIQGRGVGKGDRVLIWGPNSPHWVLSFFGCLRAGAVVVPLDLRCPPGFAENVSRQTEPKLAFVSRLTPESHKDLAVPEVFFEEMEAITHDLPEPEPVDVGPDVLAEIMFTSGTTGDPKGVMLSHGNLTSNIRSTSEHITAVPSDRLLSVLPLSHMFEQLGGLLLVMRGGANVTYPTSRQPSVLYRTMRDRRVTKLLLVPQGLELLMNGIEREVRRRGKERAWQRLLALAERLPFSMRRVLFRSVHKQFGGSLGLIICGGAPLDQELAARWELLGIRITQGYGATEASPVISFHKQEKPRYDSVGPPVPDMEVRVTEDGELLIRGPNVTRGYWRAPEKTAEAFDGDWYRTGDQGFLDEKGNLHLRGRKKDMIVLPSGQNVFPEDIEVVLRKHDAVSDAVVVGLPRGAGVEVHAALLLEDPSDAEGAVSWANAQLAEYQQIRGQTVWPDEDFPRTHTMKVKKGIVLDVLTSGRPEAPAEARTATGADEARGPGHLIAEASGYPLDRVRPEMTLSGDLGLDSLGRVGLLSEIDEELGVYLDESQLDEETTVQALMELVETGARNRGAIKFPGWGMSWWCRPLRGALQRGLVFPLLRLTNRLRVIGRENLLNLDGPVLFTANHCLFLDNGLIIKALPLKARRRLAIAAWDEPMRNPVWMVLNPLLGNGFPFAKERNVRASLDNMGKLLDGGWSVLIYPEGELTIGGPMKPFKSGPALAAVEGRVPVVPLRVDVRRLGSPALITFLRRSDVEVRFGKPISFPPGTDYGKATGVIENAVRAL